MNEVTSRLIIADPSLCDTRGHHFNLTLQLARGARESGIECILLVNKCFSVCDFEIEYQVLPIFSLTMYDRYKPELKHNLPNNKEQLLHQEVMQSIDQLQLNGNDHIFCHTAFGDFFRIIPLYFQDGECRKLPYLHLCTPYELEGMPGRDVDDGLEDLFSSPDKMPLLDERLFLWAETPQLATEYVMSYGKNMRALPLPPPDDNLTVDIEDKTASVCYTALYLGAAREEKGFNHLPRLLGDMHEQFGKSGKLKFIIQCTPQIVGRLPGIQDALDALKKYPASYVELIENVLSDKDYNELIARSDVVLLLYDQKKYRVRGSGIAVEALGYGKAILTTDKTFCSALLKGKIRSVTEIDSASEVLADFIVNRARVKQVMNDLCWEYKRVNSRRNYVRRIINQASNVAPDFLPSNLIGKMYRPLLKS